MRSVQEIKDRIKGLEREIVLFNPSHADRFKRITINKFSERIKILKWVLGESDSIE